ncbi:MAG: polysaccharide biosynthesis tyrosine autokinase [Parvibaculum sp.]|nr:polysaccharide biosynthesis tyrosine autokinase [Parvibaculum sp.]
MNSGEKPRESEAMRGYGAAPFDASEGAVLDIHKLLAIVRRRIWLVLVIAAALMGVATAVIWQITPRYTATTTVMIDTRRTQVIDMPAVLSDLSPNAVALNAQAEIIRSRAVTGRVIEKLDLGSDPEFNPMMDASGPRLLSPRSWLPVFIGRGKAEVLPPAERARVEAEAVFDTVRGALEIVPKAQVASIDIGFTSPDREKAALIANAVADAYVVDQLEAKFQATRQATEWLNARLGEMRVQLDESERAVEIFRAENDLLSASTEGGTLNEQQLSELNSQLITARADLAAKQVRYQRLQQLVRQGGSIETAGEVMSSGVIGGLRQQQAELARRQAELSSRYGPRHPEILKVQAEQRDLAREIANETGRILENVRNEVDIAATRVQSLEGSLDGLRQRASGDNQAFVQLRALEREAAATRTLYESFLTRFRQTTEQEDLQTPDARVISEARVPTVPSYPKTRVLLAAALMLSFGAGLACALALELLDDSIHTTAQAEEMLGVVSLGVIPLVGSKEAGGREGPHGYLLRKPLSSYSEAFRSLRTALTLSNVDHPPRVVLFTSALPGEGKTTAAVSFAISGARAGLRTVVVDCDLRRPKVAAALGLPKPTVGLVEHLARQASLEEVMLHHEASGVDCIPIAAGTSNPAELLSSQHMRELMEQLKRQYDLVVVDSAPVLPVSDTLTLAKLVDTTLFMVRWNETPKAAARNALREFINFGLPLAGVVLAQVDMSQQRKYGYGDGSYYYGNYSGYHSN